MLFKVHGWHICKVLVVLERRVYCVVCRLMIERKCGRFILCLSASQASQRFLGGTGGSVPTTAAAPLEVPSASHSGETASGNSPVDGEEEAFSFSDKLPFIYLVIIF
jgi:hypothetical protein